jgi:DNA-binding response OmpR family regulator
MQPEDIPRAAPLVIAVYGQESDKNRLARTLAQDGYDVRLLKHAIVLRTPTGSAGCGVKRALRGGELAGSGARILSHGKLSIDTAARTVTFASTPIRLRRREYELLVYLARDPTRVFKRHELLRDVWGYRSEGVTRTLDSHACRLRQALARAGAQGWVRMERGVGYCLTPLATTTHRAKA